MLSSTKNIITVLASILFLCSYGTTLLGQIGSDIFSYAKLEKGVICPYEQENKTVEGNEYYNFMLSEDGTPLKYCSSFSVVLGEELVFTGIDKEGHSQYYFSSLDDIEEIGNEKWKPAEINNKKLLNDSPNIFYGRGMYTEDFERFYYCKCKKKENGRKKGVSCNLWRITYKRDKDDWSEPEFIRKDMQAISPFVYTNKSNQDILYFAAKSSEEAKFKLYRMKSEVDKSFSADALESQEKISSNLKEFAASNLIFPFYDEESGLLYFSADNSEGKNYDVWSIDIKRRGEVEKLEVLSDESYDEILFSIYKDRLIYSTNKLLIDNDCRIPFIPTHIVESKR